MTLTTWYDTRKSKFKIGDRVRYTDKGVGNRPEAVGSTGTVTADRDAFGCYCVLWDLGASTSLRQPGSYVEDNLAPEASGTFAEMLAKLLAPVESNRPTLTLESDDEDEDEDEDEDVDDWEEFEEDDEDEDPLASAPEPVRKTVDALQGLAHHYAAVAADAMDVGDRAEELSEAFSDLVETIQEIASRPGGKALFLV